MTEEKYTNRLVQEKSPYLLQHAHNPVDWYPWGEEAFERAKKEDRPIFLSIGYSTCHWCHVMARESFEDPQVAKILNDHYISIKVDKEERPDIDSIYMRVCLAVTGSGGWPTSIFMTPEQKPFFAGTYFPKESYGGMTGMIDLLLAIQDKWVTDRSTLQESADTIIAHLNQKTSVGADISEKLIDQALNYFTAAFDRTYGGFGGAPKFPAPHNLLFLMVQYQITGDEELLYMVEKTLKQMYRGGLFDHIGYGFSRYSTDRYYLAPHFEKMLYDNALLMMAYSQAYRITGKGLYQAVAKKIAEYIAREMTAPQGGFYAAQDADSEGVEGKYYLFDDEETVALLGKEIGGKMNAAYGITPQGNFEGRNIPNLLGKSTPEPGLEQYLQILYQYRKTRASLRLDDKILTAWNSLMISALAILSRITGEAAYLDAAEKACDFIKQKLSEGDTLYVSLREEKRSGKGFLDDYAFYIYALINMYEATLDQNYLDRALRMNGKVTADFFDDAKGGFYLYGQENESLIIRPKDTDDGAIPSGNSVMAYNLIKLYRLIKDKRLKIIMESQLNFMASAAGNNPAGHSFFLLALSMYMHPAKDIVCVLKTEADKKTLIAKVPFDANIRILSAPTKDYPLYQNQTTYYVCQNYTCQPPVNNIEEAIR